jgi:hypothetical protein
MVPMQESKRGLIIITFVIMLLLIHEANIPNINGLFYNINSGQLTKQTEIINNVRDIQNLNLKINWKIHSNPIIGWFDEAFSVCGSLDHVYVAGINNGAYARVEKRLKLDGSLVKDWFSMAIYFFSDCIIVKDKLYTIGWGWNMLVFDLNLNLLKFKRRSLDGLATSIIFYNNYIYIAGWENLEDGNDTRFRVAKWKIEELIIAKEYVSNPTSGIDVATVIDVNPISKQLWLVGLENNGINNSLSKLRIEVLDLDLNLIKVIGKDNITSVHAIAFDEYGHAYLGGYRFITKYDMYGNELISKELSYEIWKLLYANGYVYAAADEVIDKYLRQVLYVFDRNLNQVDRVLLSEDLSVNASFREGKMFFDGKNLYIAGYNYNYKYTEDNDTEWTIYSISLIPGAMIQTLVSTGPSSTDSLMWIVIGIATATISWISIFIFIRRKKISSRLTYSSSNVTSPTLYITTRLCPRCGNPAYLGDIFCRKCGKNLTLNKSG